MPLVQVNAIGDRPGPATDLDRRLAELPREAPVVVMVHGFRYSPFSAAHCPHSHILSLDPAPGGHRAVSWPRALGFGSDPAQGLAIGFGWEARGTIWRAHREAARAGRALARLAGGIAALRRRPVDIVAHSLGARVALAALAGSPAGAVGRTILISGAEFRSRAEAALSAPAGRTAEVINVTSRENDPYDALYETFVRPHRMFDRAVSLGLSAPAPNWLDMQIDAAATRAGLARLGFRVAGPEGRVCHWSGYTRDGVWPLYGALVRERLPLAALRRVLPGAPEPRWSRLRRRLEAEILPAPGNAPL